MRQVRRKELDVRGELASLMMPGICIPPLSNEELPGDYKGRKRDVFPVDSLSTCGFLLTWLPRCTYTNSTTLPPPPGTQQLLYFVVKRAHCGCGVGDFTMEDIIKPSCLKLGEKDLCWRVSLTRKFQEKASACSPRLLPTGVYLRKA